MATIKIKGLEELKKRFIAQEKETKKEVYKGMIRAAYLVKRDCEKSMPTTPVDWGNLRQSMYISTYFDVRKTGVEFKGPKASAIASRTEMVSKAAREKARASRKLVVFLGYGAPYALWVHEMEQKRTWTRVTSGPKWFEESLKRNKKEMFKIIGFNAKLSLAKRFGTTKSMEAREDLSNI